MKPHDAAVEGCAGADVARRVHIGAMSLATPDRQPDEDRADYPADDHREEARLRAERAASPENRAVR